MREKELRLALVCYGGISLAVYMHGITKEVWRMARASAGHSCGDAPDSGAEAVYRELLEAIEDEGGLRLRVFADIVAGASAGGINGIFLAQALASGQSLEPLTDLWLDQADIEALLDPRQGPAHRLAKLWALPLAWMAAGGDDSEADDDVRAEVRGKLSRFVRSRWFQPPFSGDRFTGMLLDAFEAMAAAPAGRRLLPPGQPLDLSVTVTDFGGHPERLRLHSPPEVTETEHRLTIGFSDHGDPSILIADPAELAFAARATSSFPGAFPPFSVAELDGVLSDRGRAWPGRAAFLRRILPRQTAAGAAESAVLIDGSVLMNAPFRPAIDALRERPARRAIDRRFVYVDPYPGFRMTLHAPRGAAPSFWQVVIGAVSELPRQQPIRDSLEELTRRSRRIERMRLILDAIRPDVEKAIEALFGFTPFFDTPTPARLATWRTKAQQAAAKASGYGYLAYGELKLAGVVETIAQLLHAAGGERGTERWLRTRGAVEAAVRARGLDDSSVFAGGIGEAAIAFLRSFDLGFRIRRLRLLARRVVELEGEHSTDALDSMRDAVYDSLADYLDLRRTDAHGHLQAAVLGMREDAGPVLDALAKSLDLCRLDDTTETRLAAAFAVVDKAVRRRLLLTYLGFPYFDVATLPLLQGEGLDEFDPIKVDRISPDDATSIRGGGAQATLKGIRFNTFGAFFSRAYRENDYLWGRLHGAERMIDIVVSALDGRLPAGRVAAIKRRAFLAILDEEEPRLRAVPDLLASLRREIG